MTDTNIQSVSDKYGLVLTASDSMYQKTAGTNEEIYETILEALRKIKRK